MSVATLSVWGWRFQGNLGITQRRLACPSRICFASVCLLSCGFTDPDNGVAGGVEFDFFGTVVPESASLSLIALEDLAMIDRHRH